MDACVSHVDVPVLCLFARGVCFVLYVHVSSCEMYNNESFFFQMFECMFYENIDMLYLSVGLSVKMQN